MRNPPQVLIVEDDAEDIAHLTKVVSDAGMDVLAARSCSKALNYLRDPNNPKLRTTNDPVLAVVDWNMDFAPDHTRSSEDVLAYLYENHPACHVIVYSAAISRNDVRGRVADRHPRAFLEDKRKDKAASLLRRIEAILGRNVGDLRLSHGIVEHIPTGQCYSHSIACKLVINHPHWIHVTHSSQAKALRRFRAWLEENNSTVTVASVGEHNYRLASNADA